MPRAANAHAYVTAAFRFTVSPDNKFKVTEQPALFFGGINAHFVSLHFQDIFKLLLEVLGSKEYEYYLSIFRVLLIFFITIKISVQTSLNKTIYD